MCPGSWKSGCELLFLLFLVYLVVLSFNILLGCVYTLNIHDIHECSVVCTYMCWCTHTRNGMHTTAHKQHTPCREEPFFLWQVLLKEPVPGGTTHVLPVQHCWYFFVANIQNMPMSRIRVAIGYTNSTPSTQIRANTTTYRITRLVAKAMRRPLFGTSGVTLCLNVFPCATLWPVCPMVVAGSNHFVKTIDAQHQWFHSLCLCLWGPLRLGQTYIAVQNVVTASAWC